MSPQKNESGIGGRELKCCKTARFWQIFVSEASWSFLGALGASHKGSILGNQSDLKCVCNVLYNCVVSNFHICFEHVYSHKGDPWNELADRICCHFYNSVCASSFFNFKAKNIFFNKMRVFT